MVERLSKRYSLTGRLFLRKGGLDDLQSSLECVDGGEVVYSTREKEVEDNRRSRKIGDVGVKSVVRRAYNPMSASRSSNRTRFYTFGGALQSDQQLRTFGMKRGK